MDTSGHMTNKKRHISTSMRTVAIKDSHVVTRS